MDRNEETWINRLHERMADFEMEPPEGLWPDIEEDIAKEKCLPVLPWWKKSGIRIASAAAVLLAVVVTAFILSWHENQLSPVTPVAVVTTEQPTDGEIPSAVPESRPWLTANQHAGIRPHNVATAERIDLAVVRQSVIDNLPDKGVATDSVGVADSLSTDGAARRNPEIWDDYKALAYSDKTAKPRSGDRSRSTSPVAISLFSTSGMNSRLNSVSHGEAVSVSMGPDGSEWADRPLLGLMLFNRNYDVSTKIRHRQPIRAGINVAFPISARLELESGVCYTNLTSDIRTGSETHYMDSRQVLHYIGVPVNLKYDIFSWKCIDVYGSGGVLAEQCVAGTLSDGYVLSNQTKERIHTKIEARPFQVSLNLSAGVQCNLTDLISIYVEPGMSYYFDDGSSLSTIYKDKPFNFNLNMGVRFTFGRK